MAIQPAILFPIQPDGNFATTYTHAVLTDVQKTRSGREVRASLLAAPARTLEYTISNVREPELSRFRAAWITATERLRYLVPLWCERADPTAIADEGHTLVVNTVDVDFVAGGLALLWMRDDLYQLVTIDSIAADSLAIVETIDGAIDPMRAHVFPVMAAWLTPPVKQLLTANAEHVPLVFEEEPPGVAGLAPGVGNAAAAVATSFVVITDRASDAQSTTQYQTYSAAAFDASGQWIPRAPFVWTIEATGDTPIDDPSVRYAVLSGAQQFNLEFHGGADTTFVVTITLGALTLALHISGP